MSRFSTISGPGESETSGRFGVIDSLMEESILDAVQGCDLPYLLAAATGVRRVVQDPIDTVNATSSERCVYLAADRLESEC
jgi:hypothetical protein